MATEPIGTRIRKRRQALRMTQAEFGARVGVNRSTVSAWERGKQQPERSIGAIEQELGITLTEPGPPQPVLASEFERDLWAKLAEVPELTDKQRWAIITQLRRNHGGGNGEEPARRTA